MQEPLFNLNQIEFFNLSLRPDNSEWEKYIEDSWSTTSPVPICTMQCSRKTLND